MNKPTNQPHLPCFLPMELRSESGGTLTHTFPPFLPFHFLFMPAYTSMCISTFTHKLFR